ncbi:hypothetical protein PNEG_01220 [Pneumocystis murina B123]|uniref:ATP-dependent RNA helicase DBP8 n=1 Tax=Pneumocystis murina (strain B123) TaxID=1069680 RepID=M7NP71_PNEMU|nr:hypothetical protein PNEG_01220 [Pneumocystis murina B123]EMR10508.1 hypothetical protein PNEG_01220 [Pneumocystis murina B123]
MSGTETLIETADTMNGQTEIDNKTISKPNLLHKKVSSDSETSNISFKACGLHSWLIETLEKIAITKPTAIQAACITPILEGKNCIGNAKTGSGKTMAFALPIVQKLTQDPYGVFALILTPTRELALQISDQLAILGTSVDLKQATIVGGMDMMTQALTLVKRPHIIIATPGRLADHIRSSGQETIDAFKRVRFLVLDEADRLLSPGFSKDIQKCIEILPEANNRQTLLFTATITDSIKNLKIQSSKPGKKPLFLYNITESPIAVPSSLIQTYIFIPSYVKEAYLYRIFNTQEYKEKSIIIFTNRTRTTELLCRMFRILDFKVTALHSEMPQKERTQSLRKFKEEASKILIATDIVSRGLDIPFVELVINYDVPKDPDDYIHRVGRTARAGKSGESITLVSQRDILLIQAIEKRINAKMEKNPHVSDFKVAQELNTISAARIEAEMSMTNFGQLKENNKRKLENLKE